MVCLHSPDLNGRYWQREHEDETNEAIHPRTRLAPWLVTVRAPHSALWSTPRQVNPRSYTAVLLMSCLRSTWKMASSCSLLMVPCTRGGWLKVMRRF